MKKYFSPQEVAAELNISLLELQKYASEGTLELYAIDIYGELRYKLYRYETLKFFNSPDQQLPLGCDLYEGRYCPKKCKYRESNKLARDVKKPELIEGCQPSQEKRIHEDNHCELRARYSLNELYVKYENIVKIKHELFIDSDKYIDQQKADKRKHAEQRARDFIHNKPNYEKCWGDLIEEIEELGFNGKELYDIIHKHNPKGGNHKSKKSWLSRNRGKKCQ